MFTYTKAVITRFNVLVSIAVCALRDTTTGFQPQVSGCVSWIHANKNSRITLDKLTYIERICTCTCLLLCCKKGVG